MKKIKFVIIQIIWAIPFFIIPFILININMSEKVKDFEKILFSANIAIAIFSVNFSFLHYQFSNYKSILNSISYKHISASIIILLIALFPIAGFVQNGINLLDILYFTIPIEFYLAIAISMLVKYETNPETHLIRISNNKSLRKFLDTFSSKIDNELQQIEKYKLSDPTDQPTHEWTTLILPEVDSKNNAFDLYSNLGISAIKNSDIHTFENVIKYLLKSLTFIDTYTVKKNISSKYKISESILKYAITTLQHIIINAYEYDKSHTFVTRFLYIASTYLTELAYSGKQTDKHFSSIISIMENISEKLLEANQYESPLITIVIARQAAQKGLDAVPSSKDSVMFFANLVYLIHIIKRLGQKAIKLNDSHFLYRCLDALGWLGCSAVKKENFEMITNCLQCIVQLGREARAKKMTCFWTHCSLSPFDHAYERIEWMLSWIPKTKKSSHDFLVRSFSDAISRLKGFEHKVELILEDNDYKIKIISSNRPYINHYVEYGIEKTIDYSDPNFLKELKLY